MSVSYETLKTMSEQELVDRYNDQAGWTAESLESYGEELRHREICGLLKALRAELASPGETGARMIDQLCSSLLELLESPSSDAKERAKAIHNRARRFLELAGHGNRPLSE